MVTRKCLQTDTDGQTDGRRRDPPQKSSSGLRPEELKYEDTKECHNYQNKTKMQIRMNCLANRSIMQMKGD